MNICDYSGMADYYDLWCSGDAAYNQVAEFYLSYLSRYRGVFAELGVGTGRIAIPLMNQSDITLFGIDISKEMLKLCEARGKNFTNLKLINSDFFNFSLPQKANLIYMPFRTIGHALTTSDLHKLFQSVEKNLVNDGTFIFDHYVFSKNWAIAHDDVDITMYEDDEIRITDHYRYDFTNSLMHCVVKCNDLQKAAFDFRWIEVSEIYDVFPRHGFLLHALYGDFDLSPWTPNSPNQIWVLKRGA